MALSSFIKRKTKAARASPAGDCAGLSDFPEAAGEEAAARCLASAWAKAGFQQASGGQAGSAASCCEWRGR